jgi:fido (protein-threonine AMPylation protein)
MPRPKLLENAQAILDFIKNNPACSTEEIRVGLRLTLSVATLKRYLQSLVASHSIVAMGANKNRKYILALSYELQRPVNPDEYFTKDVDQRIIKPSFNQQLLKETLTKVSLFSPEEFTHLEKLQTAFNQRKKTLSKLSYTKEMERLSIDLSWKSSQIEGNTYTLLETERLLLDKETAGGKTKDEAVMLLNHKAALDFILSQPDYISPLTISRIEDIHRLLIDQLDVPKNIRNRAVGIAGTNYRPLDNEFQIKETLERMCQLINEKSNPFEKSLLALTLISYIQPFEDGNKRTARLIANAILIHQDYCPISFRTVDKYDYKNALLIFYEQNSISPFKKLFIDQFEYAVNNYF